MSSHDDVRLEIITLWKNTTKTHDEIARNVGVSQSTVSRTIKRYEEEGTHKTKYENCHRPRIFDERDMRHMRKLALDNPRAPAAEIQRQMVLCPANVPEKYDRGRNTRS